MRFKDSAPAKPERALGPLPIGEMEGSGVEPPGRAERPPEAPARVHFMDPNRRADPSRSESDWIGL